MHADIVAIHYTEDCSGVDWARLKADLVADDFDNGRTPAELESSFDASQFVVFAWEDDTVVGTARLLADGVCNAYLIDVWTVTPRRRRGIGSEMVTRLLARVPGHHVVLFTEDAIGFYEKLGFAREETGMSLVVGSWLNRPEHFDPTRK